MIDKSAEYLQTRDATEPSRLMINTDLVSNYYGRYLVFFKYRTGDYLCAIGPHWYISLIGFTLIAVVGGLIIVPLWDLLGALMKLGYLLAYSFALGMYVTMFLLNPGIIPQKRNPTLELDSESKSNYSCLQCLALKAQNAFHCDDCDVCIEGFDHHCVWVGKCVGQRNLIPFYIFVGSIPLFFVFMMFMSCFITLTLPSGPVGK